MDEEAPPMVVNYEITPVTFKGGRVRQVWHQKSASDVRQIPVTADLNEKYVALLAALRTEPSSE